MPQAGHTPLAEDEDSGGSSLKSAGANRAHDDGSGTPSKIAMFAIGTVGQAAAIWIVCGGVRTVGGWLGESWDDVKSDGRAAAIGVAIGLMWLKQLISLKWVIKRRIDWSESIGLSITMAVIFVGYAIAAATQGPSSVSALDGVGCALFLLGWGLSTGCELQRI